MSGATASNITYTVDGVGDPGDLTAVSNNAVSVIGLFNTASAQGDFAVQFGISTPDWRVDIPISVLGNDVTLSDMQIGLESFNSGGTAKVGFAPIHRVTVSVLDSGGGTVTAAQFQDSGPDYPLNTGSVSVWTADYTFSGDFATVLSANTDYVIRASVSSPNSGNYVGFTDITVNGVVPVPEPAGLAAAGLVAVAGLICRRRWRA